MKLILTLISVLTMMSCTKEIDNTKIIYQNDPQEIAELKNRISDLEYDLYQYNAMTAEVKITLQDIIDALTAEIYVLHALLDQHLSLDGCVDISLIDPNGVCYEIYAPVCGCNGVEYSNDCHAESNGVISYTDGICGG